MLAVPLTVTTTFPVVAVAGTGTTMLVELQLVGVAGVPLNVTVLEPCEDPKFTPVIVTGVPAGPAVGERLDIPGPDPTTNSTPLLAVPPTITTTFPVTAPLGTGATMAFELQLVGAATIPLNSTTLEPCDDPKFAPLIVTEVPTGPEVGFRLVMAGDDPTTKRRPLLENPLTVTMTFPVVAAVGTMAAIELGLQLLTEAGMPLNVTIPPEPRLVPLMVTVVPAVPDPGLRLVRTGGGSVTEKLTALLD